LNFRRESLVNPATLFSAKMKNDLKNSKKGSGLFITLILIFLVVLATMGYHNYQLIGRISRDVSITTLGDHAVYLAESALEEAMWTLNRDINKTGTALFAEFRRPSITGQPYGISIPVPHFQEIVEAFPFMKYKLKGNAVQVDVIFERAFSTMPYEKYGTVRFNAEVTGKAGFGRSFRRTVQDYKEFRSILISTPRPYGQIPFYVQDVAGWVNPSYENKNIEDSKLDITTGIPRIRQGWHDYIEAEFREYDSYVNVDQYHAMLDNPPLNQAIPPLVAFPQNPVAFSKLTQIQPLERLNLPGKIAAANQEILQQVAAVKAADLALTNAVNAALDALDQAQAEATIPPAIQALAQATAKLSDVHVKRLNIYKDFQSFVIVLGGAQGARIGSFFSKYSSPAEWRSKALHIIDEGADVNLAFQELKSRFAPLNGVVFVNNPSQTLVLKDLQIKGKLFVVTSGNLELGNIQPLDPSTDLLSFLSYGRTRISGMVMGSVSPMGELDMMGSQSQIVGNLVFNRIYRPDQLRGGIEFDPRVDSGKTTSTGGGNAKSHYYYVGIGPRSIAHHLDRTPLGLTQ
jgi:hypothetical protein